MAAVVVQNGVVLFQTAGDRYTPIGSTQVACIIVNDTALADPGDKTQLIGPDGSIFFQYTSTGTDGTHWFDLGCCVSSGAYLQYEVIGTGVPLYAYVK